MPRAFSSGALSMLSKDRNLIDGLCFDRTLVMAAVNVVLPWSMCPIVPTLQCGLFRSNFSFAINQLSAPKLLASAQKPFVILRRHALPPKDLGAGGALPYNFTN